MSTIKDVAKRAGVSPTTVSIILNGKAEDRKISQATLEKVMNAVRDLDLAGIIIELECLTGKNEDTDCQPQSQRNNLDEVGAFSSYQCLKSVI